MKGAIDPGRIKPNAGRTNQKLYFARLQLDRMQQLLATKAGFAWEAEALAGREAVLFHLQGAYLALLQELAVFYRLQGELTSTEALRLAMAARDHVAPEVTILQQLERTPDSWLAAMLAAYQQCLRVGEARVAAPPEDEPESLGRAIGLVSVQQDEPLSEADMARLAAWQTALTAIVREFRSERVEF